MILETEDASLIGAYTVTLRSEISFPDDYTLATFTTMTDQYDFTIYIEPCKITNFEATIVVPTLTYQLNSNAVTSNYYLFEQTPAVCNYPQTVTTENLPDFVTHNEVG